MRVFISANGEGLGHVARMAALFRALEEAGHTATIACYGKALEWLQEKGVVSFRTLPEMRMVGAEGRFDLLRSIIASSGTPLDLMKAYLREKDFINRNRFDAVVSDSRLSTVLAGERSGLPTFYVTNQTEFKLPSIASRVSKMRVMALLTRARLAPEVIRRIIDVPLSLPYGFADAVLIPDFKPPATICLPLLSHSLEMKKKTWFVGPMSLAALERTPPAKWRSRRTRVLVTLGGQQLRMGMVERLVRHVSHLSEFEFLISSLFVRRNRDVGNVRLRIFLPDILPYAKTADIIIMPAGHSGIMESILLRKPGVVIPDIGQAEQESNARMYKKLGLGEALTIDRLDKLGYVLRKLKDSYEYYIKRLDALARAGRGPQNGARNTTRMLEEWVERMAY